MNTKAILNTGITRFAGMLMLLTTLTTSSWAQTATWTNSPGGEWNTALGWDSNIVPGVGTNAIINGGYAVTYDLPMAAASFAGVTLGGALAVNANGFNIDMGGVSTAPISVAGGSVLDVNANGVVAANNCGSLTISAGGTLNVSGNATIIPVTATATNSPLSLSGLLNVNAGGVLSLGTGGATTFATTGVLTNSGTLTFTNTGAITLPNNSTPITAMTFNSGSAFTMTNTTGSAGINVGANSSSAGAILTINGGTVTLDKMLTVAGGGSRVYVKGGTLNCLGNSRVNETGNDTGARIDVSGGVANLGNFSVYRCSSAGGLVVANGVVNATGLQIQTGNSTAFATINTGGVVTNTGLFTVSDTSGIGSSSADRRAQFLIRGGTVVSTAAGGIVLGNQSSLSTTPKVDGSSSGSLGGILDINAGSLTAEKITLIKDNTITNAYARLNLSGTGIIYLGSGGLVANVGPSRTAYNIALSGGTMAAKADWSSAVALPLSGTVTFQAADLAATPRNISLSGILSGSGAAVTKTGGGTLTLSATNTYNGVTTISGGTLALAATGLINSSPQINIAAGAVFDVQASSGTNLLGTQTLAASGAVAGSITALSGAKIQVGGNITTGTLTFSNALSEAGNVMNYVDLSDDPTGTLKANDLLVVLGNLAFAGTNTLQVNPLNGPLPPGSAYKVIQYGGILTGDLGTNLVVGGVSATLSNDAPNKTIWLVTGAATRAPTSVVWLGSSVSTTWDTQVSSNWLNVASAVRDIFVTGDNARFDDTGATNPVVTLVGSITPSVTTVDSSSNYTFTGSGTLDGTGGLTKTNSGTLTILTLNNGYSGPTVIGAGTLAVSKLANGGLTSGIGSSSSDPTNLVFYGSTLSYLGGNVTSDHGATLDVAGGTIEVTNPASALTLGGTLVGSGALIKTGPGTLTLAAGNTYTNGTIISNGVLRLSNANGAGIGGITNQSATLRIATSTSVGNAVEFRGTCTLDLNNNGGNQALNGAWSGDGTVNFINQDSSAIRTFTMGGGGAGGGDMANFTGTINIGTNNGIFRFNDGGGTYNFGNTNLFLDLGTSTARFLTRNRGVTIQLGALAGGSGTVLTNGTDSSGTTTFVVGGRNVDSTMAGSIRDVSGAPVAITKVGTGTWTLSGSSPYNGATTISEGVLALSGSGAITKSPTIDLAAGAFLDSSARTDGALVLNSGQTLLGEGTVRGSLTVKSNATLSPGPSAGVIGKLTVTNALTLQPGHILLMDVDHSSTTNDAIVGMASVTYGGTLTLNVLSVDLTSSFKLFTATSYGGAFDLITPTSPGTGWVWDISNLTVDGTLKVKNLVITLPNIASASVAGSNLTLSGTGGPAYYGYTVYTSSDLSIPVTYWSPLGTGNFKGDGSFVFTTPIDTNGPPQFYAVQYTAP